MARVIAVNHLSNENYSIKMLREEIINSDETCAEMHQTFRWADNLLSIYEQNDGHKFDHRILTKITTYNLCEELIQIRFNAYSYSPKTLSNGVKNLFYSERHKNKIALIVDDNIISIMSLHQSRSDDVLSRYLGKDIKTRLPVNGVKKHIKCVFNNTIGDEFRKTNSYDGYKSEGRCIVRLMVNTLSYDDNTMDAFLSFMIHKIEVTKNQRSPIVVNAQVNVNRTEEDANCSVTIKT